MVSSDRTSAVSIPSGSGEERGPTLEATELRKVVGRGALAVTAVDGVSLQVARGELLAIVGPSGSGKSTLLAMLGSLSTPTGGSVRVDGVDVSALSERARSGLRARRIGFVLQRPSLVPFLTVVENVGLPGRIIGMSERRSRERALALLDVLHLGERAAHLPEALSGGERQRVALARALLCDPALVLADEPTANLDATNARGVSDLLAAHTRGEQRAGVLVTHDPVVAAVADRVLHLEDGRLVDG